MKCLLRRIRKALATKSHMQLTAGRPEVIGIIMKAIARNIFEAVVLVIALELL
jgi:hypothetical protein